MQTRSYVSQKFIQFSGKETKQDRQIIFALCVTHIIYICPTITNEKVMNDKHIHIIIINDNNFNKKKDNNHMITFDHDEDDVSI